MELTIKDKSYKLKFGLAFLKELDKQYDSTETREGLANAIGFLMDKSPLDIVKVAYAGLAYLDKKPNFNQVEKAVELLLEEEGTDKVCDDFLHELSTNAMHSTKAKKVIETYERLQKKLEEEFA